MPKGVYSRTDWTPALDEKLLALRARGFSAAEIGARIGVSGPRCHARLKVLNGAADARHTSLGAEKIGRTCLCCGKTFLASGRFLRLCGQCRRAA